MNWDTVETQLEWAFRARSIRLGDRQAFTLAEPFPLAAVMNDAIGNAAREEFADLTQWPGNVAELLARSGIEERPILFFVWDGLGPTSSTAGLSLIGNGRRRFLCYWDEEESYRALATLRPWNDPVAMSTTVSRILACNGEEFGVFVMGSLPHVIVNSAPSLISSPVIRQACFDVMQRWQLERGDAWASFAEDHYGRIVEPNHLERSLDIIESFAQIKDLDTWLEGEKVESAAMSTDARQRLLDEWFETGYVEIDEPEQRVESRAGPTHT